MKSRRTQLRAARAGWLFICWLTITLPTLFAACGTTTDPGTTSGSSPSPTSTSPASLVSCDGELPVPDDRVAPIAAMGSCVAGACIAATDCPPRVPRCSDGRSFQAHGADLTWAFSNAECQSSRCVYRTTFAACFYDSCLACSHGADTCIPGGPSPYCGKPDHSCSGPCGAPCFAFNAAGKCINGTCQIGSTAGCGDAGLDGGGDGGDASADASDDAGDADADAGDATDEG